MLKVFLWSKAVSLPMQEAEPLITREDHTLPSTGNPEMAVHLNVSLSPGMFHIQFFHCNQALIVQQWQSIFPTLFFPTLYPAVFLFL